MVHPNRNIPGFMARAAQAKAEAEAAAKPKAKRNGGKRKALVDQLKDAAK